MRGAQRMVMTGALLGAGMTMGCGGGGVATPTERLWVSNLPTSAKTPLTAFVTTRSSDAQFLGAFFHGTLLRGQHDVFRWEPRGKDRAHLELLQDERSFELSMAPCKPERGFDHCLELHGGPYGKQRFYSRKRWVVRRPGKREVATGLLAPVLVELAEDDDDLAALLDATAAATTPEDRTP